MADELRKRAEARLAADDEPSPDGMSPDQVRELVHELRTHQIELELQNEELRRSQVALAEARDRYVDLYDFAPIGYLTLSTQNIITEANLTATRMVGIERSRLIGRGMSGLVAADDQEVYHRHRRELLNAGGRRSCDLRLKRENGDPFWARMECTVWRRDGDAEPIVRVSISDISETMALAARLQQSQKLEALGVLAGGVAHEINNPIMGIMNYAQLLLDDLRDQGRECEYASEIIHETERVATIVRNLLHFARQETEDRTVTPVHGLVECTLSLIRALIGRDGIELNVDIPGNLPEILCRRDQIEQVLMALLTNAREALNLRYPGHDPDKLIRLTAQRMARHGQTWLRLTVEDHGNGIAPGIRDRVFDPFFTTKNRAVGTGLGLSVSVGIVRDHGGDLTFETKPGQYTRFYVELPAAEPEGE